MDDRVRAFIEQNHAAAMVTLRADGTPHAVRVGVGLVDGKLWSSGTLTRLRTKHLRRDPRATLFVFDAEFRWLALETNVVILDGADAPKLNLRFMQEMQRHMPSKIKPGHVAWFGKELTIEEFLQAMADEQRLIYEFEVKRAYGMY